MSIEQEKGSRRRSGAITALANAITLIGFFTGIQSLPQFLSFFGMVSPQGVVQATRPQLLISTIIVSLMGYYIARYFLVTGVQRYFFPSKSIGVESIIAFESDARLAFWSLIVWLTGVLFFVATVESLWPLLPARPTKNDLGARDAAVAIAIMGCIVDLFVVSMAGKVSDKRK